MTETKSIEERSFTHNINMQNILQANTNISFSVSWKMLKIWKKGEGVEEEKG